MINRGAENTTPVLVNAYPAVPLTPRALFVCREQVHHQDAVDRLTRQSFSTQIGNRPVYRFRQPQCRVDALCKVAINPLGEVQGSIRYYDCGLRNQTQAASLFWPALLLGPLSVDRARRGQGLAHQLISRTLEEARARGHRLCLVVGDPKLYRKHGFCNATSLDLRLTGQEDLRRFMICELRGGCFSSQMRGSTVASPPSAQSERKHD